MKASEFTIREVCLADCAALTKLEQQRWEREPGVTPIDEQMLGEWIDVQSPFFLVAERANVIEAYFFATQTTFVIDNIPIILREASAHDFEHFSHDPASLDVAAVSLASRCSEAAAALDDGFLRLLKERKVRYYHGFSRIANFASYVKRHEEQVLAIGDMDQVALWYALQTGRLVGQSVWKQTPTLPDLCLPIPRRPDAVLGYHLARKQATILGVSPNYMPDDRSHSYGVFAASRYPHIR